MNLEITKIIEQYLMGELSPADKKAFEERLAQNEALRSDVELQKSICEAAKRSSIRLEVQNVSASFHLFKKLKWGGLGLGILAVLTASVFYLSNLPVTSNNNVISSKSPAEELKIKQSGSHSNTSISTVSNIKINKLIPKLSENANIDNLKSEFFTWNANDTAMLSKEGILISIPKDALLLDGKPYNQQAVIQWQEALDGATIVKSGLSTVSNGNLLETQGMFSFSAKTADGKQLTINPKMGVYVQVPVDEFKEGMKLFDGEKDSNGIINWVKPRELEKIPVAVPMAELDFYPSGYEQKLDVLKAGKDKKYRDSLYLSFEEGLSSDSQENAIQRSEEKVYTSNSNSLYRPVNGDSMASNTILPIIVEVESKRRKSKISKSRAKDTIVSDSNMNITSNSFHIPPSAVLAFWNPKLDNTNLATREFENRMRAIHKTCDKSVLDIYTKNLDKPIYELDKRAAAMGYPEFNEFAAQHVGALNPNNPHIKGLQAFYSAGVEQLKRQQKSNREKELKKRNKWGDEVNKERQKESSRTNKRVNEALNEEIEFNYKKIGRQLGGKVVGARIYGASPICNLDQFVVRTTIARKTGEFYDEATKKTYRLQYNDFQFTVANSEKYQQVYAYLFPDKLNSYHRINAVNNVFSFPLNNEITYDLAIVGISADGYSYLQVENLKKGDLGKLQLIKTSETKLDASIQSLNEKRGIKAFEVKDELKWLEKEQQNYVELKRRANDMKFRNELRPIVFPCLSEDNEAIVVPEILDISEINIK